jgi:hypothetical protein
MKPSLGYWINKFRLRRSLASNQSFDWELARKVWAMSPRVYDGLIGYAIHSPLEFRALQRVVQDKEHGCEALFAQLLNAHPMVVGWSLLGLLYAQSPFLLQIPPSVFARKEQIAWQLGHIRNRTALGDFARQVYDQYMANSAKRASRNNADVEAG